MTLTIVIPAYNESEALNIYLPQVIEHCEKNNYKLIVVNDGSKDTTKELLENFCDTTTRLTIVTHKVNRGYGAAIKSGIKSTCTDYVLTIDADGQHSLIDADRLFNELKDTNADMIIGSRKGQKSASFARGIGKYLIKLVAKILMPINVYDLNSGMKIYDTGLAKKYIELCPESMAYSDVIVLVFVYYKRLVKEIPIKVKPRIAGTSTINLNTAFDTIRAIINIVLLFNPMKIFLPASLVAFIISMVWGIPIIWSGRGVSTGTLLGVTLSIFLLFLGFVAEQISMIQKRNFD